MNYFEDVVKGINEYLESKKESNSEPTVTFSLGSSLAFNEELIREKLQNVKNLDDRELYNMLKQAYSRILEDIFTNEQSPFLELFTDTKFLTVFIQVINSVVLSHMENIYCNKIAYDFLTSSNNKSDEYIRTLFFTLSKTVNKNVIPGLLGLGLEEGLASYIALSRYSSTKEFVNIRRVNYLIISSNPNQMTEQMIITIYEKLFDRFTDLFKATMFDRYADEELANIGPGASEIYSNISLAVIDILNVMTSIDIRKVLISYAGDYNVSVDIDVRFSIKSLAVCDYSRIIDVVDYLEKSEMIIVP